ncbi:efflux RND transporter periplasmic adaptor subunit [Parasulfitobacter algicola]|uniref:Efflux transporter, RND family, MFP subunit n=1 Tax=Parasulfitobacter algicola TaxID=2614809 RepID=A0ABX2IZA9_9RHOB|nr:HlyD family efflux transporter periplasmic adaptor subunit [Sulfitobacter algicola]NSX56710.1 hypothetical protein [Sulfitobacter algicola]
MNWRILLFIPAIGIGAAVFAVQMRQSDRPNAQTPPPTPMPVRVTVPNTDPIDIAISGYGRVEPVRTWQSISQVDGRIIFLRDDLAIGNVVPANTDLIKIDPRNYEIALAKARANLQTAQADLDELNAQQENTRAQLKLEQEIEVFLQNEFERNQSLVARGAAAQATLEQANRELLNQQRQVLDLSNQLALIPVQRIAVQSNIQTREVELEEAQRNLDNTVIQAPFHGRVADQDLAVGEYIRPGDQMIELHDVSASEVVAAVQPNDLFSTISAILPAIDNMAQMLQDRNQAIDTLNDLGFQAEVRQTIGNSTYVWPAQITRFNGLTDNTTGTIGIAVRVASPTRPDRENRRPPLNNGSFVEVVFRLRANGNLLTIPRSALHYDERGDTYIYTVSTDNTLLRNDVTFSSIIENRVVISTGVAPDAMIVLSDPQPAVLGMPLTPVAGN